MSWNELIAGATAAFRAAGLESPEADARELAEVAGGERLHALLASGSFPTPEQRARFDSMVAERAVRVPLQHITGVMYFRYLELLSRPGCFIVRPETELVAEEAITALRAVVSQRGAAARQSPISLSNDDDVRSRLPEASPESEGTAPTPLAVDLCTGSGAIALALATEVANARVIGVELSETAMEVARENNVRYGSVVDLVQGDARTELSNLLGQVDVVVDHHEFVRAQGIVLGQRAHGPPGDVHVGGGLGQHHPLVGTGDAQPSLEHDRLGTAGCAEAAAGAPHADGRSADLISWSASAPSRSGRPWRSPSGPRRR